jgi:hypothetical protein
MSADGDGYVTPVPPRPPGGPSRLRWLGVLAGFAVLVGVVLLQRHSGNAPAAGAPVTGPISTVPSSTPTTTPGTTPTSVGGASSTVGRSAGSGIYAPTVNLPMTPTPESTASSASPYPTSPSDPNAISGSALATTLATEPGATIPGEKGWEIVGYGTAGLVRIDPSTGRIVLVPGPNLISDNPMQGLVSVKGRTLVTAYGAATLLFPDSGPVQVAPGDLANLQAAVAGPDPAHLWVAGLLVSGNSPPPLKLVDWAGHTAATLTPPPYLSSYGGAVSDGAGYLLASGIGGVYDVRPGSTRLVTHGQVLATGPTGYLVYECGDTPACQTVLIDRSTGHRQVLRATPPANPLAIPAGLMSPDGTHAAFQVYPGSITTPTGAPTSPQVHLVDLPSGRDRTLDVLLSSNGPTQFAFSPDGRYLIVPTLTNRIAVVDTATGTVRTLPMTLPAVSLLTVRATTG